MSWVSDASARRPVGERVVLAGDSYADGEDWGSVHVAVRSARAAVDRLVGP